MSVAIIAPGLKAEWWERELARNNSDLDIDIWPDISDPGAVEYALAWKPPAGALANFPDLKAVFSLGAGVDHLFIDPDFPKHVKVARVIDPYLTAGMVEYVVLHVLRYHKNQPALDAQQTAHVWDDRAHELKQADERRVGILGLGELGRSAGEAWPPCSSTCPAGAASRRIFPASGPSAALTACRNCWHARIFWSACCRSRHRPKVSCAAICLRNCRRAPA